MEQAGGDSPKRRTRRAAPVAAAPWPPAGYPRRCAWCDRRLAAVTAQPLCPDCLAAKRRQDDEGQQHREGEPRLLRDVMRGPRRRSERTR